MSEVRIYITYRLICGPSCKRSSCIRPRRPHCWYRGPRCPVRRTCRRYPCSDRCLWCRPGPKTSPSRSRPRSSVSCILVRPYFPISRRRRALGCRISALQLQQDGRKLRVLPLLNELNRLKGWVGKKKLGIKGKIIFNRFWLVQRNWLYLLFFFENK